MVTHLTPSGHMAAISQRRNETRPYHYHWQDHSRSVSCPTNRYMVRTTESFITKRYDGLFQTISLRTSFSVVGPQNDILVHLDP